MNAEDHGANNATAWWENIKQLIWRLEDARAVDDRTDEIVEREIMESALSVEVRSNWYTFERDADTKPGEYRILLTTGGPALQLTGSLTEHGEPETAELEHQDWGTLWTKSYPYITDRDPVEWEAYEETLLAFARCFYFGE